MLRRLFTCAFALLLFGLAFSIPPRSTPSPCAETNTTLNMSPQQLHLLGLLAPEDCNAPALRVVANLFLPQLASAQSTAIVADSPATRDTTSASASVPDQSSHWGRKVAWCALLLGVVLVAIVFVKRRNSGDSEYGGGAKRST